MATGLRGPTDDSGQYAGHTGASGPAGAATRSSPGGKQVDSQGTKHPYIQGGAGATTNPITGEPLTPAASLHVTQLGKLPSGGVNPGGQPGHVAIDPATGLPLTSVPDQTGLTGFRGPTGPADPADPGGAQLPGHTTSALGVGSDYQGANSRWANRGVLERILNAIIPLGFGNVKPNPSQPASYAGGDYHFGVNPAGFVGGIAGAATGVPAIGAGIGEGYSLLGGKDVVLGGPGAASIPGVTPGVGAPSTSVPGSTVARAAGGPPSSTPSATIGSPASVPIQSVPGATPVPASTSGSSSSPIASGQKSQGGGTVISGSNTVAWPWSSVNG